MEVEGGWSRARIAARFGIATAGLVAGGMATLVTASAQDVVSALPLCAAVDAPGAAAPCVSGPNVVGGTELYDQATVYASADRSVRFLLWAPGTCGVAGDSAVDTITVPVGGDSGLHTGTVQTPTGVLASSAGTYEWTTEVLRSDLSLEWGPAPCADQQVNVIKATPQLTTQPSTGGVLGTAVRESATLHGGDAPQGSVEFALYGPSDTTCSGAPLFFDTEQLPAHGALSAVSLEFTPKVAGTYHWTAAFTSLDENNLNVIRSCADSVVITAPPQQNGSQQQGSNAGTGSQPGNAIDSGVQGVSTPVPHTGAGGSLPAGVVVLVGGALLALAAVIRRYTEKG